MLDPLSRLAIRHGTDKWGQHQYTPIYHQLFAHLREAPVRVLELGIGWPQVSFLGGASLAMWRDYFPHARVVGIDLAPKRLALGPRVTVLQGSQTDAAFLREACSAHGPFDIVVDDGSHRAADVLASFGILYPLLAPDGFYAIEDTQTAFWPDYGGAADGAGTVFDRLRDVALAMHAPEAAAAGLTAPPDPSGHGAATRSVQVFRNLMVFERGPNAYPSNRALDLGHVEVRSMFDALAAEAGRDPTVGAALVRAGMLEVGGDDEGALAVARQAWRDWPDALPAMCLVQHLALKCGHAAESLDALRAMLARAPDEALLRGIERQMVTGAPVR